MMKNYCKSPSCGWLREVDEQGFCVDCRKLEADASKIYLVEGLVAKEKERQAYWRKDLVKHIFVVLGVLFVGVFWGLLFLALWGLI